MAITSYATLKSTALDWCHRPDFAAQVADAVAFTEARLYDMLLLKNAESEEALTLTKGQNFVALPTGYISPIAFWLVVSSIRVPLQFARPQELPYFPTASYPKYCAIDGDNIRFDCPASSAFQAYFRCMKSSALSDSNTSNYLLTRRPDIYLAGTIAELARYMQDEGLYAVWESKFQSGCKELKAAENRARGLAPLRSELAMKSRSNIFAG